MQGGIFLNRCSLCHGTMQASQGRARVCCRSAGNYTNGPSPSRYSGTPVPNNPYQPQPTPQVAPIPAQPGLTAAKGCVICLASAMAADCGWYDIRRCLSGSQVAAVATEPIRLPGAGSASHVRSAVISGRPAHYTVSNCLSRKGLLYCSLASQLGCPFSDDVLTCAHASAFTLCAWTPQQSAWQADLI